MLTARLQKATSKRCVMRRTCRPVLFAATLLLAAYLRLTGLAWGINTGYGHEQHFQPDEYVSLRGVRELNLPAGRIAAPGAYFEGTFNYYLWAVSRALLKFTANKDPNSGYSMDIKLQLLYTCRLMSVLFDLCTVIIVFLAIREATRHFYSSLLGALLYAVVPIQVIYAHFMRTHILSNLGPRRCDPVSCWTDPGDSLLVLATRWRQQLPELDPAIFAAGDTLRCTQHLVAGCGIWDWPVFGSSYAILRTFEGYKSNHAGNAAICVVTRV
jgi:hypothetical protein